MQSVCAMVQRLGLLCCALLLMGPGLEVCQAHADVRVYFDECGLESPSAIRAALTGGQHDHIEALKQLFAMGEPELKQLCMGELGWTETTVKRFYDRLHSSSLSSLQPPAPKRRSPPLSPRPLPSSSTTPRFLPYLAAPATPAIQRANGRFPQMTDSSSLRHLTELFDEKVSGKVFMDKYFGRQQLQVHGSQAHASAFGQLFSLESSADVIAAMENVSTGHIERVPEPSDSHTVENGLDNLTFQKALAQGESFILHFPSLEKVTAWHAENNNAAHGQDLKNHALYSIPKLAQAIKDIFAVTSVTANLYVSGKNSSALNPHTDTKDAMILQLQGQKNWRTCVPLLSKQHQKELNLYDRDPAELSDVQLCEVAEGAKSQGRGCSVYPRSFVYQDDADSVDALRCTEFTIKAGDVLYLPKGVIHVANESSPGDSQAYSVHVTLGIQRKGLTVLDFYGRMLDALDFNKQQWEERSANLFFGELRQLSAATSDCSDKTYELSWKNLFRHALAKVSQGALGTEWRLGFPNWVVRQNCPRALSLFGDIEPPAYCLPDRDSSTFKTLKEQHQFLLEQLEVALWQELQSHPCWQPIWAALEHAPPIVKEIMEWLQSDQHLMAMLQQVISILQQYSYQGPRSGERNAGQPRRITITADDLE